MKKTVAALLMITVLLSCKKSTTDVDIEDYGNCFPIPIYLGKWELRTQFCGWGGQTNFNPGNNNTLTLYTNGRFSAIGVVADTGMYRITSWVNRQGQIRPLLNLTGKNERQFELDIRNDTLRIDNNSTIADGCGYTYKRVQ